MPRVKFSVEELEHSILLLSAEIDAKQHYVKMARSVISHFRSVPKGRIRTSQPKELPATPIINKPAKRRGRPAKVKTVESRVVVATTNAKPQSVPLMRLEDDFIARTANVDPNARKKKKRRRRSHYRR